MYSLYHPLPPQTDLWGYIGITLSVCLSVQRKLNLGINFWTDWITYGYSLWQDLSIRTNFFIPMTLTSNLYILSEKLTLAISFEPKKKIGLSYYAWILLMARPSVRTKIFDPVILTSNFDLLLKKTLPWHLLFTIHMDIPCCKNILSAPKFFIPCPWPPTLILKKLYLGITFWNERDRTFILRMCISCCKTFLSVPKFFNPWPWSPTLIYFYLCINFWTERDPKITKVGGREGGISHIRTAPI